MCYTYEWVPWACRLCISNPKIRILGQLHSSIKKTMYINNVLTKLRVNEGILREKLELSKKDWKEAKKKYGLFHLYHQH